jgi:hypothetical protein
MNKLMAILAKRDQIRVTVGTQVAAKPLVMDLESLHAAAVLAPPMVTLQHLST